MDMMCEARGAWILFPHQRGKEGFNEKFLFGVFVVISTPAMAAIQCGNYVMTVME